MNKRRTQLIVILTFFTYLLFENFFSLFRETLAITQTAPFIYSLSILLLIVFLGKRSSLEPCMMHFKSEVRVFLIIPIISCISCWIFYNQPFSQSLLLWLTQFPWLLYFILHEYKINSKSIIIGLLIISLVVLYLEVFGQIAGTKIGGLKENEILEERNGLLRFRYDIFMAMLIMFYFWEKMLKKIELRNAILFVLMIICIYLCLTRQAYIASLIPLFLGTIVYQEKTSISWKNKCIILSVVAIVLFIRGNDLFSSFIDMTSDDLEDNIRSYAMAYYWSDIIENPIKILIGNGMPHKMSEFGRYYASIKDMSYYADDVGLVGTWWFYGVFYIIAWGVTVYKVIWKYRKEISLYLKLFAIGTSLISFYLHLIAHMNGCILWLLFLYLVDNDINNKLINKDKEISENSQFKFS